jgi:ABC-type transport system involved in multi-copper enzyme maturation permease subunit
MASRKRLVLLLTGLCLISIGGAMAGNAFFSGQPSIGYLGGFQSEGGFPANHSTYAFLKPSDRLIVTLQTNSSSGTFDLTVSKVDGATIYNQTSEGTLSAVINVPERGAYLLSAIFAPPDGRTYSNSLTITVAGHTPDDYLWPGLAILSLGAALTFGWALLGFRREEQSEDSGDHAPSGLPEPERGRNGVLFLVANELVRGRKILFTVPVLFAIFYSAGAFNASLIDLPSHLVNPNLSLLFTPSLSPYNDWLNIFPIVVVLATYSFSYERESKILRTILLNPISSGSLFFAKLLSIVVAVEVPIIVGILLALAMFDPLLFLASPLAVLGNAPNWLVAYTTYGFVMIGIALLPSVIFRKAIYSFIVPLFVVLAISTEGFGLGDFVPWRVWATMGTDLLSSSSGFENAFSLGAFMIAALPAIVMSVGFILASWMIFTKQDKE